MRRTLLLSALAAAAAVPFSRRFDEPMDPELDRVLDRAEQVAAIRRLEDLSGVKAPVAAKVVSASYGLGEDGEI